MAASVSPSLDHDKPMDQMNTTPLIDVLLVLLIMFIITIPVQTHAVKLDIPRDKSGPVIDVNPVRNLVTVDAAGIIRWNGTAIDRVTLRRNLERMTQMTVEPSLEIKPDAQARYVVVDEVLADIKRSGVKNLGFVGNEAYARF